MGILGSRLVDQTNQLDGEYALVLNSQKNVHHSPGPEEADNESADNWLELKIFQWRAASPTLILKMVPASSGSSFKQELDQSTDALKFIFQLPAEYPGGRIGLLSNIQDLIADAHPHGIVETHLGRQVITRILTKKRWSSQHEKEQSWTNAPKAYNCKAGWTQFSSQYFFKFRVNTGEAALLVVDRHADKYKSAVGQRKVSECSARMIKGSEAYLSKPPQQQLYFMQLMTLPVRVWMFVQHHRPPGSGDESEEHKSQFDQPHAKSCHDASPLDTEEKPSTGILGEFMELIKNSTQQAACRTADMDKHEEPVTGEHTSLDSQNPEKSVISPSEGGTEKDGGMSDTPLNQSHAIACENLRMDTKNLTRSRRKQEQKKRKKAFLKAAGKAHADAQPQNDKSNDERSTSAACGATGQTPVFENVDLIEGDLRSPTSGGASFLTCRSQDSSRITTSPGNIHPPALDPDAACTREFDEESVPGKKHSIARLHLQPTR